MKKFSFLLMFVACFGFFLTSCEKNEVIPTNPILQEEQASEVNFEMPEYILTSTENLSDFPEVVKFLKKQDDIIGLEKEESELDWDNANISSYSGTTFQSVNIPIFTDNDLNSVLTVYVDLEDKKALSFIIEMKASDEMLMKLDNTEEKATVKFSGEVTMYSSKGEVLANGLFKDNQAVSINYTETLDKNWKSCVINCVKNAFPYLPWYIQTACGGSASACIYSGNPYACTVAIACAGSYLVGCSIACL